MPYGIIFQIGLKKFFWKKINVVFLHCFNEKIFFKKVGVIIWKDSVNTQLTLWTHLPDLSFKEFLHS